MFRLSAFIISSTVPKYVYPCVLMRSRYMGVYEGGDWIAFGCDPKDIPEESYGDDVECAIFWNKVRESGVYSAWSSVYETSYVIPVAVGKTKEEAEKNLLELVLKLEERRSGKTEESKS